MKVSIIIPTYNEKNNIKKLIPSIFKYLKVAKVVGTIIVVDDNSPDGTSHIIKKLQKKFNIILICREKKLGIGSAYIAGMHKALEINSDKIITMDADWSHQPKDIPEFLKYSKQYGLVLGSRYINGGKSSLAGFRLIMSRGANFFAPFVLGLNVNDVTNGYRCYDSKLLGKIDLASIKTNGYSFLQEILFLLLQTGTSFKEIPVFVDQRISGKSKLGLSEIPKFFLNILRLKFLHLF